MRTTLLVAAVAASCMGASAHAASWKLAPYAGVPGALFTQLEGINDHGVLVLATDRGSWIDDHGARTAYAGATLTDISNDGTLVGDGAGADASRGFVDDHGAITLLSLPGAVWTTTFSISANGRYVSGIYETAPDQHTQQGFVYDRSTATYSVILAPTGQYVDSVGGVNDRGVAVGILTDDNYESTSFLYDVGTGTRQEIDAIGGLVGPALTTLNDAGELGGFGWDANFHLVGFVGTLSGEVSLITPPPGQDFAAVMDLNNAGQAIGWVGGTTFDEPDFVATEVSAVPEPDTAPLLLAGLVAVATLASRRSRRDAR